MVKTSKKKNYGEYLIKNKESILKKKKKIKNIKRGIVIFVIFSAILITLCFNLEIFNIKIFDVTGAVTLDANSIKESSKIHLNTNIFKVKLSEVEKEIRKNPYILEVEAKRNLPDKIVMNIKERKAAFYIEYGGAFYIVDNNGIILEKRDNVDNINIIKLEGFKDISIELGKKIENINMDKFSILCNVYSYLYDNELINNYKFTKIEVNDFIDIKLFTDKFYIKLGTTDDVLTKLSKAFSILKEEKFSNLEGYIDVSFNGNPVVHMNK